MHTNIHVYKLIVHFFITNPIEKSNKNKTNEKQKEKMSNQTRNTNFLDFI